MGHRCMCLSVNDRTGGSRRVGVSTRCALSRVLFTYSTCNWVLGANLAAPMTGRNEKPNRTGRTEPNRLIPEPAGTGRGTEPNRTGPSHDASEKRRPNRVEPGNIFVRTEPNRTDEFRKVRNRNESNGTGSFLDRTGTLGGGHVVHLVKQTSTIVWMFTRLARD